ncbi:hypothetical protein [Hymenobacter chitinivorans]|nr:hypothetical protein [Hymenobacter chitinivorans]
MLRRNATATGFSDTIPYSKLTAAGLGRGLFVSAYGDNPAADSCIAPFASTFPNDKTIRFAQRFPAVNTVQSTTYIPVTWEK